MSYFQFLFYYLITSTILILIISFIYRFYIKHKCSVSSKIAEKAIDDYFKAFDIPDTLDDSEDKEDIDISLPDTNKQDLSDSIDLTKLS